MREDGFELTGPSGRPAASPSAGTSRPLAEPPPRLTTSRVPDPGSTRGCSRRAGGGSASTRDGCCTRGWGRASSAAKAAPGTKQAAIADVTTNRFAQLRMTHSSRTQAQRPELKRLPARTAPSSPGVGLFSPRLVQPVNDVLVPQPPRRGCHLSSSSTSVIPGSFPASATKASAMDATRPSSSRICRPRSLTPSLLSPPRTRLADQMDGRPGLSSRPRWQRCAHRIPEAAKSFRRSVTETGR